MKNKTFIISIIAVVLIFGGIFFCINRKKPIPVPTEQKAGAILKQAFDAKATIKMKDLVMIADINKTAPGVATIKIIEPKTLSGMNFNYNGADIKIGYKGLSIKLDENSKLVSSLAEIIVSAIDKAASDSGISVQVDGKVLTVSGESDSGKFIIKLDREKGSIASITLPELEFECRFDDFLAK